MRFLIVEDDLSSRRLLEAILGRFGDCNTAVNGQEAVEAFRLAWEEHYPYTVIFMDIMMPEMDGLDALEAIRAQEAAMGIKPGAEAKVVMTTALEDPKTVVRAYYHGIADSYLVKPIEMEKVSGELTKLGLLS